MAWALIQSRYNNNLKKSSLGGKILQGFFHGVTMGLLITKTDVETLISPEGIDNLTDDGAEDALVDSMIQFAETKIIGMLGIKHTASTLALAPVVKQIAVYFSAYFLSERRGNPSYYKEQFEKAEDMLLDLRNGDMELVDASGNILPQDNLNHLPITMQNLVVDESDQDNRIRTRTESSFQTANENTYVGRSFSSFFGR